MVGDKPAPVAEPRPMSDHLRIDKLAAGAIWRLRLNAPKANILDGAMVMALQVAFEAAGRSKDTKAILLEGEGPNFSFGASVPEHLPEAVAKMLQGFHGMFRAALASGIPCLAVVHGHCLGGGLELASFCQRVFASHDVRLGQPEIKLGVFAPMASLMLADRVGRAAAEDLCLTGRSLGAKEALSIGLVDETLEDPGEAALAYAREHFLPLSASSLRLACRALRLDLRNRMGASLERIEALYLEELVATRDAEEGLRSFIEKRKPTWRNQ